MMALLFFFLCVLPRYGHSPVLLNAGRVHEFCLFFSFLMYQIARCTPAYESVSFVYLLLLLLLWITTYNITPLSDRTLAYRPPACMGTSMYDVVAGHTNPRDRVFCTRARLTGMIRDRHGHGVRVTYHGNPAVSCFVLFC